ncbi:MAG: hypothetical protein GY694_05785 [Gammaproteobacteria bacterium]|nr:hypothetical protein [Gammaproteobacteria bacterium]
MKYEMRLTTRQTAIMYVYWGLFWLALIGVIVLLMSVLNSNFSIYDPTVKRFILFFGVGGVAISILFAATNWFRKKGHWYVYIDENIFIWEEPNVKNNFKVKLEDIHEFVQLTSSIDTTNKGCYLSTKKGRFDLKHTGFSWHMDRIRNALRKNKVRINYITEK